MTTKTFIALVLVTALFMMLTGCSQSQLTMTLTAVSEAANAGAILLTGLAASGLVPGPLAMLVAGALTGVANAAPQIQTELESADPLATQIAKCVGILEPLIIADIPGIPANLQGIISGINGLIQSLIQQLHALLPAAQTIGTAPNVQPAKLVLSYRDRRAIKGAVTQSAATVKMLAPLKAAK